MKESSVSFVSNSTFMSPYIVYITVPTTITVTETTTTSIHVIKSSLAASQSSHWVPVPTPRSSKIQDTHPVFATMVPVSPTTTSTANFTMSEFASSRFCNKSSSIESSSTATTDFYYGDSLHDFQNGPTPSKQWVPEFLLGNGSDKDDAITDNINKANETDNTNSTMPLVDENWNGNNSGNSYQNLTKIIIDYRKNSTNGSKPAYQSTRGSRKQNRTDAGVGEYVLDSKNMTRPTIENGASTALQNQSTFSLSMVILISFLMSQSFI